MAETIQNRDERKYGDRRDIIRGLMDIAGGFQRTGLATRLALLEVRRRYKRTKIGPFWTTLSMALFVFSLGFVFSLLWNLELSTYLPYLVTGFLAWMPFSSFVVESASTFTSNEPVFRQVNMPYFTFVLSAIIRNFVIFLHHSVVYVIICIVFHVDFSAATPLVVVGLALLFINGMWISMLVALACSRYRDIQPLLANLLNIVLWVTPIFWPKQQMLERAGFLVHFNVVHHMVDLVRSPLLGTFPEPESYVVSIVTAILGWTVTIVVFSKHRRNIIYWL